MNKAIKSIVIVAVLAAVVVGAFFLYRRLSENYKGGNLIVDREESSAAEPSKDAEASKSTEASVNAETSDTSRADEVYQPAPDFTVYDAGGKPVKLSDFKGKPVVLNFWASWCPPCKAELPDFDAAYKKHPELNFVMVNLTGGRETVESAKDFVKEKGFSFPVYFDTEQEAGYVYGASSIPMTFFITGDGGVAAHAVGMIDAATLERGIDMIK